MDVIPMQDLLDEYKAGIKLAQNKVSTPNVLVAGLLGVGKTSIINSAYGYHATEEEQQQVAGGAKDSMSQRAVQYRLDQRGINIWDSKGQEAIEGSKDDENLKYLLNRLNTDEDPAKHIHVVWYVVGKSRWKASDDNYCSSLLQHTEEFKVPVICIINKADEMTPDDVDKLRQNIFRAAHGRNNLKGVFTSISETNNLISKLKETLEEGQIPKHLMVKMLEQKLKEELASLHQLDSVVQLTKDLMGETAKESVVSAQKMSLRSRELAAADVIRDLKTKFETSNKRTIKSLVGGGKKYFHVQVGKMVRRLAFAWGFLKTSQESSNDETMGRELMPTIDITNKSGAIDPITIASMAVLWSANFKLHLINCLEHAAGRQSANEDHLYSVVDKTLTDYSQIGSVMAMFMRHHEEEIKRQAENHTGAQPQSIIILRIFDEAEKLVRGEDLQAKRTSTLSLPSDARVKKASSMFSQLIEMISDPSCPVDTRDGFFCSYRLSVKKKPIDVLRALSHRFEEANSLADPNATPICKQIFECFVHWITNYFEYDFMESESMTEMDENQMEPAYWLERGYSEVAGLLDFGCISPVIVEFYDFIDKTKKTSLAFLAEDLCDVLAESINKYVHNNQKVEEPIFKIQAFKPVAQYDAFLIAAHLSFVDYTLFKSMSARDFFTTDSPKRLSMINQANLVTYWVVKVIVEEEMIEKRLSVMKKMIEVAYALQDLALKNFHGFMAVMTGLQLSAVSRLKKTWAALKESQPTLMEQYERDLVPLASPGNGLYANVLDRVMGPNAISPPCVPFLGSFLTALERAKVSGGNKGTNAADLSEAARIQGDVVATQQRMLRQIPLLQKGNLDWESFNLVPRFDEFLKDELPRMFDLSTRQSRSKVEDDLSQRSLVCEPRAQAAQDPDTL